MSAHEDGAPFEPGDEETEAAPLDLDAIAEAVLELVRPRVEELAAKAAPAPVDNTVEIVAEVVAAISPRLEKVWESIIDIHKRFESLAAEPAESRLDSLEARIMGFGQGGESAGDALAVASYALACARQIVAEVGKITGSRITLPPAPQFVGPLPATRVDGAELAATL